MRFNRSLTAALALGLATFPAWSQATGKHRVIVTDDLANTASVYDSSLSGKQKPLRKFGGEGFGKTQLNRPSTLAIDPQRNEIYVPTMSGVLTFRRDAQGDAEPLRKLGSFLSAEHLAVDPANHEIYVASLGVEVYSADAAGDDAKPLRKLNESKASHLDNAGPMAVDPVHNELWVLNDSIGGKPTLNVYPRTASGDTPPLRSFDCGDQPDAIALDLQHDEVYVALRHDGGELYRVYSRTAASGAQPVRVVTSSGRFRAFGIGYDPTRAEVVISSWSAEPGGPQTFAVAGFPRMSQGEAAPTRVLQGDATGLRCTGALCVDPVHGETVVLNHDPSRPGTFATFGKEQAGNVAPLRRVGALHTPSGITSPQQVAVDPGLGRIYVANTDDWGATAYSLTSTGDPAPLATYGKDVKHIAVDAVHHELLCAGYLDRKVSIFASNHPEQPARVLSLGKDVLLDALAFGPKSDEVFVAVTDMSEGLTNEEILAVPRTATDLTGARHVLKLGEHNAQQMVYDPAHNELIVLGFNEVLAVSPKGAAGPLRVLSGKTAGFTVASGVAVDPASDSLVVSDVEKLFFFPRLATGDPTPTRTIELDGQASGLCFFDDTP